MFHSAAVVGSLQFLLLSAASVVFTASSGSLVDRLAGLSILRWKVVGSTGSLADLSDLRGKVLGSTGSLVDQPAYLVCPRGKLLGSTGSIAD